MAKMFIKVLKKTIVHIHEPFLRYSTDPMADAFIVGRLKHRTKVSFTAA